MGFAKEYEFLTEIGIEPRNSGAFVNGVWKGSGSVVSSVNPANNKVITSASNPLYLILYFNITLFRVLRFILIYLKDPDD